ncbi:hypothetical protein [Pseudonocardia lacus]|uniref:hypothetical protein n=1 Tax=Pseudonocardia lacus TaxID=2835865 RepID=UPI001BDD5085|nr:hypothetical protein [Pseudonocardia lacus]
MTGKGRGIPTPSAAALEGGLLGLLLLDAILLAGLGLVFTPFHVDAVPVPVGAFLVVVVLPWLVLRAADIDPRPSVAGAPLWAWLLTTVVLGLWGPGGDAILPMGTTTVWMSLVLVGGGLLAGVVALRRHAARPVAPPPPPGSGPALSKAGQDGGTR